MLLISARRAVGVLTLVALLLASLGGISLAVPSESKLEDAREREKKLENRVERAEAELRQVEADLEVLQGRLAEKEAKLEQAMAAHREAEAAAADASADARRAEEELDAAVGELEANLALLGNLARDAYKFGAPSSSPTMTTMELMGSDSDELADRLHYLTRGLDSRSDALERSDVLRITVEVLTERALETERVMQELEAEAQAKRDSSAALHAQVQDLVSEQSAKLDRAVQLVAEIEDEHAEAKERVGQLEEQVKREREEAARRERERQEAERREAERREAERIAAEKRAAEQRAAERRAAERRAAQTASSSSSGSSSSGSSGSSGSSSSGSSSGVTVRSGSNSNLVTVGGITVHSSIASQLERLLNDARADGIVFGGHGYRSPEVTARLRIANGCPDVYDSPASSCRIPTARPGSSMHEKGLAIDFTYRGQTICFPNPGSRCSGNAGFDWLQRNAHKYGLKNLPTEAWHWSTNGT